ncbi:hypothetical protein [Cellulomonas cellasea]|uniref:Uncharacterized protein n=2 Tax=Cellulomonas cellasea TaxID=43670 RepID=A0A0A0B5B4_9CELL|nr:hypothetical protein [Cellulomonas cellasea]KGM02025.1 hypothetical protein Q760_15925 [Cellulomonas cellasea DSM 20118]GEA86626.1 hypothetical protein CCE01nite_05750 [Cellulomonas cellasea]
MSAAMQAQRFEADEDGEEADGASPTDTLDVDVRDFMGINEADRAGESDYVGTTSRPTPRRSQTHGPASCAAGS